MTRLRKMMLEELQRRNYSAITTRNYLRVVTEFAKHFGKPPDRLGLNELRTYQAYLLRERKPTPGTVVNQVSSRSFTRGDRTCSCIPIFTVSFRRAGSHQIIVNGFVRAILSSYLSKS